MKFGSELGIEFVGIVTESECFDEKVLQLEKMAIGEKIGQKIRNWKGKVVGVPSEFQTVVSVVNVGMEELRIHHPAKGPSIFNVGFSFGKRTQLSYIGFSASKDTEEVWRQRLNSLTVLQDVTAEDLTQVIWDAQELLGTSICIEFS